MTDWQPGGLNDSPPVGLTRLMLIAWLEQNALFAFHVTDNIATIAACVERHYGMGSIPREHGPQPATWEIYAFVAKQEKATRGGQTRLAI